MSTKHTPGPWRISRPDKQGVSSDSAMGVDVAWCPNSGVFTGDAYYSISKDEARANARLVAAAPDLLEACKAFIDAHEIPDALDCARALEIAEERIRTVVAKAKEDA